MESSAAHEAPGREPASAGDQAGSLVLPLEAFLREMQVYSDTAHMLFLGAGASVASGVPSAISCIQDWKNRIYQSKNSGCAAAPLDVQRWLALQENYPAEGAEEEYAFYAEKCYPRRETRCKYFDRICTGAKPSVGYRLLSLLADAEMVKAVWTTNFDGLTAKATTAIGYDVVEASGRNTELAHRPLAHGKLLYVPLHGDYRYDSLRNLPAELRTQDETLRLALKRHIYSYRLIVIGYSGRDESVMQMLKEAYAGISWGGLFWCGATPDASDRVSELLLAARQNGTRADYVPGAVFDDMLVQLSQYWLKDELLVEARKLISAAGRSTHPKPFRARKRPVPVISRMPAMGYASLNLAGLLLARAANLRLPFPDSIWPQISNLPSLRIDRTSITRDGRDVIFRSWLGQDDGTEKELWARVGIRPPSGDEPDTLEGKLIAASEELGAAGAGSSGKGNGKGTGHGNGGDGKPPSASGKDADEGPRDIRRGPVVFSRIGRDTLIGYGATRKEIGNIGRIAPTLEEGLGDGVCE